MRGRGRDTLSRSLEKRLRLTLRSEGRYERLTPGLVDRLLAALEGERRAVVVTLEGEGDVFCEGLDPGLLLEPEGDVEAALHRFAALLRAIETTPRPVLALVDGTALGGGVGLAAASDLVLATPRATFGLPEALLGLVPAMVFPVLARRVGTARARWLALGAATLSAEDAWRLGLVDEVADDLEATAARHLRRLERMDPRALAEVKAMAALHDADPERYPDQAAVTFRRLLESPETRARLARFMAGDVPWPEDPGDPEEGEGEEEP